MQNNMDSIQKGLSPLLRLSNVLGLTSYGFPAFNSYPYLSNLYIFTLWTIHVTVFFYVNLVIASKTFLSGVLFQFMVNSNLLTSFVSTVSVALYKKKFEGCIEKLNTVDDTLETLGALKGYRQIYTLAKSSTVAWFIVYALLDGLDIYWSIQEIGIIKALIIVFPLNHHFHANNVISSQLCIILRHIGTRFDKVNDTIQSLVERKSNNNKWAWANSLSMQIKKQCNHDNKKRIITGILTHVHLELCKVWCELNRVFEVQLAFEMGSVFVYTASAAIFVFDTIWYSNINTIDKIRNTFIMNVWSAVYFMKLLTINYMCERVSAKAYETKVRLSELMNTVSDMETRNDILQFSAQLLRKPLTFSAMGFFDFGFDFLRRFLASVTTVIIILLQMNVIQKTVHPSDDSTKNP